MALPTSQNLDTLDYDFLGEPFNDGTSKASIDLDTLDYDFLGEPFNGNEFVAVGGITGFPSLSLLGIGM